MKSKAKLKKIKRLARLFLMWFESDGKPVDGFRFREQHRKLADAVSFEKWFNRRFKRK